MVEDGASSHKVDYVQQVKRILLNGWILPIGGASAVKGLRVQPAQQACFQFDPSISLGRSPASGTTLPAGGRRGITRSPPFFFSSSSSLPAVMLSGGFL